MAILISAMNKPKNASYDWSTACNFWRAAASVCPTKLIIEGTAYAGFVSDMPSIEGDFLGGTSIAVAHCTGTNTYIQKIGANTNILHFDIWKALADGQWSSSAAFTIKAARLVIGPGTSTIRISAQSTPNPAEISRSVATTVVDACPTETVGTLTVFDDGTFTFA